MINKVILMGGVADRDELGVILSSAPCSTEIINLHSENDLVLRYLLKLCKFASVPIGLKPLKEKKNKNIKNYDCTSFIDGHS